MGNSLLCEFRKIEQKKNDDGTYLNILKILIDDKSKDIAFRHTTECQELYDQLKQIPRSTDIQLFYELFLSYKGDWGLKPISVLF